MLDGRSSFILFVAWRYLRRATGQRGGGRFLQFISAIAIGGVAVGVAALVLALAIVHGFSEEIEGKIIGFGAHVQVESLTEGPLSGAAQKQDTLRALSNVRQVAPVVSDFVLLRRSAAEVEGAAVWGADALPAYVASEVRAGVPSLQPQPDGKPTLIVGQTLARRLGLEVGAPLTVFSLQARSQPQQRPTIRQFIVGGVFETALADYDERFVFAQTDEARHLIGYGPDEVTRLDVTLSNPQEAASMARSIEEVLGFPVMARTIFDVFRGLFAWVDLQQNIIPVVIAVIVLVAAFNIIGILMMFVLEKTRAVGILASMGASQARIQRLFVGMGFLIGLVGTLLGLLLALVLALVQLRFGVIPLPAEAYFMTTAPIALRGVDFLWVGLLSLALCTLAAYIPARIAARLDPVRVIRFR
ncbi:MAG: FtsX-like permease family protein [Bacteroidetes bacterium]|jgi:lipoprotein-releasing system permease protein|nr:FtsX-like permease family protein [Bacteroidota bacterium]